MDMERGLDNLGQGLTRMGVSFTDERYLDFLSFDRALRESLDNERRFMVLSPQETERRERILRQLDVISLEHLNCSFTDLCRRRISGPGIQKKAFAQGYAPLVGVGGYSSPRFRNLPATISDVDRLYEILVNPVLCGYVPENVRTLTGDQANKQSIVSELKALATRVSADSTVLIYFSGHGGRTLTSGQSITYLCPREADPGRLDETALSGAEFTEYTSAIVARRLLVVLDACHSGNSADFKSADGEYEWKAGLPDSYYVHLSHGAGRIILAACKENQYAYVRSEGDYSLFSWHFCNALLGRAAIRNDGYVRILDVFDYVSTAVKNENPGQEPILRARDVDNNFPIAVAPRG